MLPDRKNSLALFAVIVGFGPLVLSFLLFNTSARPVSLLCIDVIVGMTDPANIVIALFAVLFRDKLILIPAVALAAPAFNFFMNSEFYKRIGITDPSYIYFHHWLSVVWAATTLSLIIIAVGAFRRDLAAQTPPPPTQAP